MSRTRFELIVIAAFLAVPALHANETPLRPGLWEVSTTVEGAGGRRAGPMTMAMQHCVGANAQTSLWDQARAMQGAPGMRDAANCSTPTHSRHGNAQVVEFECKEGDTNVKARITTTVGSERFESDTQLTFNPPRRGRTTESMKMVGKYLGACPADMKPGTMRMAGMPAVPAGVTRNAK